MKYRPEVDGLRALAVIPVVLYHAGFTVFSGGFVGVDVFFVISGYLITTIILSEISEDRFSLLTFYERRARRILPPLFVVIFVCIPFSWAWLIPSDFVDFTESILAVLTFSSNVLFWLESGYFEPVAELKPLLHTWSLAVEEQYYILFPLFLMLMWKAGKKYIFIALAIITILSLSLAQWEAYNNPERGFYLLPTRGWEILLGSLSAIYLSRNKPASNIQIPSQIISFLGVVMILFAVFFYDHDTPFPSLYALVPTFGAALIILFAKPKTFTYSLLSSKILVWLGLLSYSIYLWHQPLMAFAKYRSPSSPSILLMCILVALSILLAFLTYTYIEKPFRNKQKVSRRMIFTQSGIGMISLGLISTYVISQDGLKHRYSEQQQELLTILDYSYSSDSNYKEGCFLKPEESFESFESECLASLGKKQTFVWGDSHAMALSIGLNQVYPDLSQFTASACAPLYGQVFRSRPNCLAINNYVIELISNHQPERLIIHAYWLSHLDKILALQDTIEVIQKQSPSTDILLVGSVPIWLPSLPEVLLTKPLEELAKPLYLINDNLPKLRVVDENLALLSQRMGIRYIAPTDLLCRDNTCLAVLESQQITQLFAWDYAHLTAEGSNLLARLIKNNDN